VNVQIQTVDYILTLFENIRYVLQVNVVLYCIDIKRLQNCRVPKRTCCFDESKCLP